MTISPELKSRILQRIANEPAPTRRRTMIARSALFASAVISFLAVFFAFGGRHQGPLPVGFVVGVGLGWTVAGVFATFWALSRGGTMMGRPRALLTAIVVAAPVLLFGWTLLWNALYPSSCLVWSGRLGFKCLRLSLLMGAWPLSAMVLAWRSSDPAHPRAAGAAFGGVVGIWATGLVNLWCPIANSSHIAIGHILPIVVLSLVGFSIGPLLQLRARF